MSKALCAGLLLVLFSLFLPGLAAQADTPTPAPTATPTLLPILPTATSPYQYLRPTPTAISMVAGYSINLDTGTTTGQMADEVINVYRTFNVNHVIDYVLFMLLIVIMMLYLVRMISRSTKDE